MGPYYVCCGYDLHLVKSVVDFVLIIKLRDCGLHVVTSLLGGVPLCNSLGIVRWNSTRRDHSGNPGGLSGSGLVSLVSEH